MSCFHHRLHPALVEALPAAARAIFEAGGGFLDPADAFLAAADGLTPKQARSRARNDARWLGGSFPDQLPPGARADVAEVSGLAGGGQLHFMDPQEIVALLELCARAPQRAARGYGLEDDWREASLADLARRHGRTLRTAQLARLRALDAIARGQQDLFGGESC